MKKIIAFVMCLVMCMSLCVTAFAENGEGITYTATLDNPTLTVKSEDQTVKMTITASKPSDICFAGYTVISGGLKLTAITGDDFTIAAGDISLDDGLVTWMTADMEDISGVDGFGIITFTVPANTPAGTYTVGVEDLLFGNQYAENIIEDGATVTATLTIKAAACAHANKAAHAAKDATCTAEGNSAYWSCPDCGKFFSDEACTAEITEGSWVKEALGHNFKGAMKDNGDGKHVYKCTRCDVYGDPESHSGTDEWQKNDTNHWKECACGVKVDEAAHTWDSGNVLKEANCKDTGIKQYTCTVCSAKKNETIAIDPNNHDMTNWGHDEGTYGKHFKHCTNGCGYTEEEACSGGTATCKAPAICKVCGVNYGELGDHQYVKTEAKSATCTEGGYNEYYTCSVCDKVFKADKTTETTVEEETLKATGHNFGDWTEVEAATEDHPGSEKRVCQNPNCTAFETQPIPQLPHKHVLEKQDAVPATCTTDGNNEYYTCAKCSGKYFDKEGNELTEDDIKIPATGHDFDGQPWVTDGESHWHVCKNCTATDTKVAHSSTGDNVATCQKLAVCDACGVEYGEKADHEAAGEWISGGKGSHYKACKWCKTVCDGEHCSGGTANCVDKAVCEICGGEYGDVDPTNHKDPHTTGYVAPTCTEAGETGTGRCEACKQVISESQPINPLGHVWSEPTFTWADDYSSCKATFTCTRDNCGATKDLDCTVTSETTDSTCQDTGKTVYTATVSFDEYKSGEECKDTQKVTLPLADHDYGNEIPEVSATCTENGTKAHFECSACGKIFVLDGERYVETSAEDLVISATGHAWGEWKTDVEPTYDAEGSAIRVCANDDSHVEDKPIPKLVKDDPTNPTDPTKPVDNNKPETGDAGVGIWVAVLTVSALFGTAIVVKKRHA